MLSELENWVASHPRAVVVGVVFVAGWVLGFLCGVSL